MLPRLAELRGVRICTACRSGGEVCEPALLLVKLSLQLLKLPSQEGDERATLQRGLDVLTVGVRSTCFRV